MNLFRILRWVWDGKSGTSAMVQTFVTQILIIFVTLATGVITARFLGPAGRGEQAAVLLWPDFLGNAFALGIGPALLFHLRNNPDEESDLTLSGAVSSRMFWRSSRVSWHHIRTSLVEPV